MRTRSKAVTLKMGEEKTNSKNADWVTYWMWTVKEKGYGVWPKQLCGWRRTDYDKEYRNNLRGKRQLQISISRNPDLQLPTEVLRWTHIRLSINNWILDLSFWFLISFFFFFFSSWISFPTQDKSAVYIKTSQQTLGYCPNQTSELLSRALNF